MPKPADLIRIARGIRDAQIQSGGVKIHGDKSETAMKYWDVLTGIPNSKGRYMFVMMPDMKTVHDFTDGLTATEFDTMNGIRQSRGAGKLPIIAYVDPMTYKHVFSFQERDVIQKPFYDRFGHAEAIKMVEKLYSGKTAIKNISNMTVDITAEANNTENYDQYTKEKIQNRVQSAINDYFGHENEQEINF
jgi:hypothetical protein